MRRRTMVLIALALLVAVAAVTLWLRQPTADWQQVDLPSGGTPVVAMNTVEGIDQRLQSEEALVAVLQVEPGNVPVRPGFVSGWHAEAFRYAHVMPNGMFRMGVRSDDVSFFALAKERGDQPVQLRLVEVTTLDDPRYTHVPLY